MIKKYLLTVLPIGALFGVAFFLLQSQETTARTARLESEILKSLSADELRVILAGQPETATLSNDVDASRRFLKGLREYLALAAQARREGLADDASFKLNFEYKKALLVADAYDRKLSGEKGEPYKLSEAEISEVWADPASEAKFAETMEAIVSIQRDVEKRRGSEAPIPKLAGEALEKSRNKWARAAALNKKAAADRAFVESKEMQLRLKILEAGILSADYLRKHWTSEIRPTGDEIKAYLEAHPELREERKKEKAAKLLERINAGENFAGLAMAESEDRTSRERGGLYENVALDLVWPEVEQAALSLTEGKVFSTLVESNTGYHIVKLEKKRVVKQPDGGSSTTFSFRHLLIQRAFADPNHHLPEVPSPFLDPHSIAVSEIEKKKRDMFVERVVASAGISIPESL